MSKTIKVIVTMSLTESQVRQMLSAHVATYGRSDDELTTSGQVRTRTAINTIREHIHDSAIPEDETYLDSSDFIWVQNAVSRLFGDD